MVRKLVLCQINEWDIVRWKIRGKVGYVMPSYIGLPPLSPTIHTCI
jgi:hypothetical protein